MRKLNFSMNVSSDALLQANPKEFYTAALLEQRSTSFMRQVLNVKEKTKIGGLSFGQLLFEAGCDFVGSDSDLGAKLMEPCKIQIGTEICLYELESSFLADWMKPGSNVPDFMPTEFAPFFYGELSRYVSHKLELLTWQGNDTLNPLLNFLGVCNGLNRVLGFAPIPVAQRITGVAITAANVISQLTLMYNQIPSELIVQKEEVLWFVSPNVADAYRLAVASQSAEVYTAQEPALNFLGYTLTVGQGMSDNTSTLSLKNNYVFLTDLVSDPSSLNIINMLQTTGDAKIRVRGDFKFGVDFLNESEWVTYGIPVLP
jgi:hypothetical protein